MPARRGRISRTLYLLHLRDVQIIEHFNDFYSKNIKMRKRPDDGKAGPGEPPGGVPEHHAGERPVDHHLA